MYLVPVTLFAIITAKLNQKSIFLLTFFQRMILSNVELVVGRVSWLHDLSSEAAGAGPGQDLRIVTGDGSLRSSRLVLGAPSTFLTSLLRKVTITENLNNLYRYHQCCG